MKENILKSLYLFNEKAEKLIGSKFVKQLPGSKIQIKGCKKGIIVRRTGPKGESIDSFILTYRFFIQNNEGSSFSSLTGIYSNEVIPSHMTKTFNDISKKLNDYLDSKTIISINNRELTCREIQEVFIYGGYAHANRLKKKTFEAWKNQGFVFGMIENEFVYIMAQVLRFIIVIRELNYEIIDILDESIDKQIKYGLIIKDPWLKKILDKEKTWEVRGRNTKIRGRIYLIRSGSGLIVGSTRLINSFAISNADELRRNKEKHCIPEDVLQEFLRNFKKPHIWELRNVKKFEKPISYKHPKGAVVWVRLK